MPHPVEDSPQGSLTRMPPSPLFETLDFLSGIDGLRFCQTITGYAFPSAPILRRFPSLTVGTYPPPPPTRLLQQAHPPLFSALHVVLLSSLQWMFLCNMTSFVGRHALTIVGSLSLTSPHLHSLPHSGFISNLDQFFLSGSAEV